MERKVLVGTGDGLYEAGGKKLIQFSGHEVTSLASGHSGWWAIVDGQHLTQAGVNDKWRPVASLSRWKASCLLLTAGGLLVGTTEAHLLRWRGGNLEVVRSFEKVYGRENWYTPWGGAPEIRSMSADPFGTLYVNVHVGGVIRSTDGGRTWEPTIDLHTDVHQVFFDSSSSFLLAASARGLASSRDYGQSWQFHTEGLHATYCRAVTSTRKEIFVTASTGPFTNYAALYRKPLDQDMPFQRCKEGLPHRFSDNIDTLCLTASSSWVAFGTEQGSVFLSRNDGLTWAFVAEGLPPVRCVAVARSDAPVFG